MLPLIDVKSKIVEKSNSKNLNVSNGNIIFKNVNFKYNEDSKEKVLNSVNLKFNGGEMTSLVGHSGAGKSTILNLIPRFYEATGGDILIDDTSIYDSTVKSLRSNISLVTQDVTLFDDTVKNNILYGNLDASNDEIVEAAKLSFCEEFIEKYQINMIL